MIACSVKCKLFRGAIEYSFLVLHPFKPTLHGRTVSPHRMSSCRVNPFLLLISLFLQTVSGCLVVREKDPNPNIQNCNCNVKLFNQEDIRNNEGGRYLGDLQVWDPIVESKQDCWLAITCKPVPGVSSFFTVMFRSNGPPIYVSFKD